MRGRKKKKREPLWRTLTAQSKDGTSISLGEMQVLCPVCESPVVGEFGSRKRIKGRVEAFQCKNPHCPHLFHHKTLKQFIITTSLHFQAIITDKLLQFYEELMLDGAKQKTLAKKYGISQAQVTALRLELEQALQALQGLDSLVLIPQPDWAIAIDETFLKIEGTSIYVIIATGYTTHKALGLKVSTTRAEEDILEVFKEAERNTENPISVVSSDALNATQSALKHLNRKIIHVIHPHKKPFDKAIIRYYQYESGKRITATKEVQTDFSKKRKKRLFRYMMTTTDLTPKPKRKRGRPKGAKTKKKQKSPSPPQKRGRKGLYTVFSNGTKGCATIDPYRDKLKVKKGMSSTVGAALNKTLKLFALMSIQNNLSENINAFLRSSLCLTGPKSLESVERRIRAKMILRNHPELLQEIIISHTLRADFIYNGMNLMEHAKLQEQGILA